MNKRIGDTVLGAELLRGCKSFMIAHDMMHPSHDLKLLTRADCIVKSQTRVWNPLSTTTKPRRRCIRKMTQLEAMCDETEMIAIDDSYTDE